MNILKVIKNFFKKFKSEKTLEDFEVKKDKVSLNFDKEIKEMELKEKVYEEKTSSRPERRRRWRDSWKDYK